MSVLTSLDKIHELMLQAEKLCLDLEHDIQKLPLAMHDNYILKESIYAIGIEGNHVPLTNLICEFNLIRDSLDKNCKKNTDCNHNQTEIINLNQNKKEIELNTKGIKTVVNSALNYIQFIQNQKMVIYNYETRIPQINQISLPLQLLLKASVYPLLVGSIEKNKVKLNTQFCAHNMVGLRDHKITTFYALYFSKYMKENFDKAQHILNEVHANINQDNKIIVNWIEFYLQGVIEIATDAIKLSQALYELNFNINEHLLESISDIEYANESIDNLNKIYQKPLIFMNELTEPQMDLMMRLKDLRYMITSDDTKMGRSFRFEPYLYLLRC